MIYLLLLLDIKNDTQKANQLHALYLDQGQDLIHEETNTIINGIVVQYHLVLSDNPIYLTVLYCPHV